MVLHARSWKNFSRDFAARRMMSKVVLFLAFVVAGIVWASMIRIALYSDTWACQSPLSCFSVIWSSRCSKTSNFPDMMRGYAPKPRKRCPIPFAKDPEGLVHSKVRRTPDRLVKGLSYIMEDEPDVNNGSQSLPPFGGGGQKRWFERGESFKLNTTMKVKVHCGFTRSSGAGMTIADMRYVKGCKKLFCFVMLVDEKILSLMKYRETVEEDIHGGLRAGIWRLIPLKHLPYNETRRNEEISKLLIHRLIPQAQYSIWVSSKMVLVADPLLILERYLWREGHSFAISQHGYHHSIYEEANASKRRKKYSRPRIDAQMKVYQSEGLEPWSTKKRVISDVPEASIIIREHTMLNNLFSCLWFNEVHLFTPLDQLSFGYVAHRLGEAFKYFMFPFCEFNSLFELHSHSWDRFEMRFGGEINVA
ncbi:probable hexosyltransferase MUCI70 isoform X3 [Coffea arabica]|uniref:Probable hexosyltransferase MUCI70 isoform X3 n=2 Tax=Coffea arabica TaxID=13443 RepID=A0ABM4WZL2_COFAR